MFRGVFDQKLDDKGRTSLPAKLREQLTPHNDHRLIVTTGLDACLHCYPLREWTRLERALAKRSPLEPGVKNLLRLYVAGAQEVEPDKLGRVQLMASLREHASLSTEVVWAGMINIIEIWSKPQWVKAQKKARASIESSDMVQLLSQLSSGEP